MAGEITLTTLDGVTLNPGSAEYTSCILEGQLRTSAYERSVEVMARAGRWPSYVGGVLSEKKIIVHHTISGTRGQGGTHETNLNLLKGHHYSPYAGAKTLVYTDGDGVEKQLSVVAARLLPLAGIDSGAVQGEWTLLDGVALASSSASVTAVAKTSSPATLSVPNAGNVNSHSATITLKPTAAKAAGSGQRYVLHKSILYRSTSPCKAWPVEVTDGGWDHAAEATATRSQADGDDVEVYANGVRLMRWFGIGTAAVNQATTKVWSNIDHPAGRAWTVKTAIADSAVAVVMEEPLVNMPATPFYVIADEGSRETIRVTAYDAPTRTLTIDRAERGTAAMAVSAATKLWHMPILIDLVYGGTSLAAPDYIDDDYKPMFLSNATANSSNAAFTYEVFQETSASTKTQARKPRSAGWYTLALGAYDREKTTGKGDMYWGWVPRTATLSTDAATASKMCIAYKPLGAFGGHPLMDRWAIQSPINMSSITITYVASSIGTGALVREGRMRVLFIDEDGLEIIAAEYNNDDYTPGTGTGTTITADNGAARAVQFAVLPYDPLLDSTANQTAAQPTTNDGFTVDDVTLTFNSTDKIVLLTSARTDAYQFGRPGAPATLANDDGDTLEIHGLVVDLNTTVSIDVDTQAITISSDSTSHNHTTRGTVPTLPDGTTSLGYTETGIGQVEMGVSAFRSAWII